MSRMRVVAVVAAAVAVLAVVGVLAFRGDGAAAGTSTDPAAFALPALTGDGQVRLDELRGRPVVVNFFASWCGLCDAELPGFATVSAELRDRVVFVGIATLETGDPLLMPRRHGIAWWPLARDVGGRQGSGLHDALAGPAGMPVTAFYDAQGRLVDTHVGVLPEAALREAVRGLIP
ncbi:MAG: TlpA family protein disulfide reductase [Pseudonocardia sp.]